MKELEHIVRHFYYYLYWHRMLERYHKNNKLIISMHATKRLIKFEISTDCSPKKVLTAHNFAGLGAYY